ncbi:helix-turn-helix domain-containing protein [Listeria monocytogenes]|uniref:helix-turn-helix domain-containing protein n=1 Tax=Listeria TaxID=1637 RepID=UPI0011EA905B|nr:MULTISPECIES: helix-turn-helix domain-containing protein [Listeria]EHZ7795118.1 helix-turn-helix domain-containing protein [Listeria monocytogenes]EHZ7802638.1 helix-turn-helix domain-containing protein [Listeria monocytogenes]EHZ7811341.1 helix-turn-helix domain-containing protein [Listeria monocytogenes]EJH4993815.1 helix-turn-helix domain-containing protein [Listeria monocytogenes]EJH5102417.1 helix-turn-helix domain-containing protein [Listeria monocytogenes]
METITSLLLAAQQGNTDAMTHLYQQFRPLLLKESTRNGELDLDCYQELSEHFIKLILEFKLTQGQ